MSTLNIVSVNIQGGLGNQLFQVASAYAYARKNNGILQIIHKINNGNRPVYWDTLLNKIKPYLVSAIPSNLEQWREDSPAVYKDIGYLTSSGKYLNGYLQSSKYFYNDEIKNEIKELFTPDKSLVNEVCNKYKYLIENKNRIVVIHARRTDYLTDYNKLFHGVQTSTYYKEAINKILQYVDNPIFVLCSDDNSYWNEIKEDICIVFNSEHFIIENESDINTFVLLQHFNNVIMSNSSFIWWTTWLSNASNVIVPSKWFGPIGPPFHDIYENHWHRID
jgi:hypothetical protein